MKDEQKEKTNQQYDHTAGIKSLSSKTLERATIHINQMTSNMGQESQQAGFHKYIYILM